MQGTLPHAVEARGHVLHIHNCRLQRTGRRTPFISQPLVREAWVWRRWSGEASFAGALSSASDEPIVPPWGPCPAPTADEAPGPSSAPYVVEPLLPSPALFAGKSWNRVSPPLPPQSVSRKAGPSI